MKKIILPIKASELYPYYMMGKTNVEQLKAIFSQKDIYFLKEDHQDEQEFVKEEPIKKGEGRNRFYK